MGNIFVVVLIELMHQDTIFSTPTKSLSSASRVSGAVFTVKFNELV